MGAGRRGAFLAWIATRKVVMPAITPPTAAPQDEQQGSKPGPRPAPGDESCPDTPRPESQWRARRRQWRSRAGGGLPFCSAERSPRPAGNLSRRCGAREGTVRRDPPAVAARHRRGAGAAAGAFLCRHKKGGRPPGRDPANHHQLKARPQIEAAGSKALDRPAPGDESSRMPCLNEGTTPPAMAKPSQRQQLPLL